MTRMTVALALMISAVAAAPAAAQTVAPAAGCTATPAQLAANKKVAMEFFRPGISGPDRVALADPSYVQHNPAFKKGSKDAGMGDYEYFKSRFGGAPQGGRGAAPPPAAPAASTGPQPPAGNPLEVVMAECDLVTIIHKTFRQDPTAPEGTFYEAFTFDVFRVRNSKLVEHWDGATIAAPPAR